VLCLAVCMFELDFFIFIFRFVTRHIKCICNNYELFYFHIKLKF